MADPQQTPPPLLTVNPDGIPAQMRNLKRWCVWEAKWMPDRQKYDKRPVNPVTGAGLSSRDISKWVTFDVAFAAYQRNPQLYAGLGFVIVKGDRIFCIDLDKCMPDGMPDARACDVINAVQTFTEYSPSGQGAHSWGFGEVDQDCARGIEVYQGNAPRYVTVTGRVVAGAPSAWREVPTPVLQSVIDAYGHRKTSADVIEMQAPDILDPLVLPEIDELDLPYTIADFLREGDRGTKDRSLMLFQTAIALHNAGLSTQEVFSVMVNNHHTMHAALEKRNSDDDKAIDYLWLHHAQKAKPKSDATRVSLDDFDEVPDLEPDAPAPLTGTVADAFDDESGNVPLRAAPPAAKHKFAFIQAAEYSSGMKPLVYLIRNILPKAEVGVIYGASGAGKSFFVLDVCMAIARGERWRGHSTRKGSVAYIVAEGARGFKLRMDAYAEHHGTTLDGLPFYALPGAPNVLDKGDVKELILALKAIGHLDLIVIDTVAQVTPGADENSGQDMGRMLAHCKAIHRATGAMVLLVGHTGKDESRGMRGWSGVKGALDVEIEVTRALHYRAVTITKMKDGTGEGTEMAFKLEVVTLGQETDEDGEQHDITSCVLVETNVMAGGGKPPKGANERIVLGVVQDLLDLAGEADLESVVGAAADKKPPPEAGKKDQRRKDMRRAVESLVESGRLKVSGNAVELL